MKKCPGPLTWQAVVDGEEEEAHYRAHLECCPACRAVYSEIKEAAELAYCLRCDAVPAPTFAGRLIAKARSRPAASFPAGLVAVLLFAAAALAALLLDPGYLNWWLSVGITRSCSLLIDTLFRIIGFGRSLNPAWLLATAVLLVLLELAVLERLKTVGEW